MSNYVVWMDSQIANIFNLTAEGPQKISVHKKTHDHHTHNSKDHCGTPDELHFFKEVGEELKNATKIVLLGPGIAKSHFRTHLETHHQHNLFQKVVGVLQADHLSDTEVLIEGKKFLQTDEVFHPVRVH